MGRAKYILKAIPIIFFVLPVSGQFLKKKMKKKKLILFSQLNVGRNKENNWNGLISYVPKKLP